MLISNLQLPQNIYSPLEEAAKILKQVCSIVSVYDRIIHALLADRVWDLPKTCVFSPGVPVGHMLAKPTEGVSEILDKFQDIEFTFEDKNDGEWLRHNTWRMLQLRYIVEMQSGKFPDVVAAISK